MKQIVFVLLLCTLFSCEDSRIYNTVLIFEKPMHSSDYVFPGGGLVRYNLNPGIISYLKGDTVRYYSPKKKNDTLVLSNVPQNGLEIQFKEKTARYNYLLQQGDTILVSIDSLGIPYMKSKVSEQLTTFYNLPYLVRSGKTFHGLPPLVGLVEYGSELERIKAAKTELPSLYEQLKMGYVAPDSLIVSFELYDLNFTKKIKQYTSRFELTEEQLAYWNYLKRLNEQFFIWGKYKCKKEKPIQNAFADFYDDKYMNYISYRGFLKYAFGYYYDIAEKVPSVYAGIGSRADSRETFKRLIKSTNIPPKTKKYALRFRVECMIKQFGESKVQNYIDKYFEITQDSYFKNKIEAFKKKMEYAVDDLLLKDLAGNKISFSSLMKQYNGKVVYLDFWASWCAPCRIQILAGKQLHKKLAKEDVVFLYFALSDREFSWKKACAELGIEENNYFVINPNTAKIIVENKVVSIPRYFLFDKNGKLIDNNAPRPKEEVSEKAIIKYLKK